MMLEQVAATVVYADEDQPRVRGHLFRAICRRPLTLAGAVIVLLFALMAILGPMVAPHDPTAMNYSSILSPPSRDFPFGTDDAGHDVLSRVLAGARISLTTGLVAVAIAAITGTVLGLVAGYTRGVADGVVMRLMDVMLAFPDILLAIVVITILGPGLTTVMIAVGVAGIPSYTRTVRAAVLTVREQEYVEAARALGAPAWRIMLSHVLRNVLTPIVVLITLSIGLASLTAAGLSFVGLGAQPPSPEWGDMLNEAQQYLQQAWWMAVFPGVAIVLVVLGLNLLGDGLREILDPALR
jgi:peptide/nickel transport system permease protein